MKKIFFLVCMILISTASAAASKVIEGVIEKSEVITTKVGKNGRPLVGAAVGVGVGSAFGSGSGKDAAKIVGGLIGASKAGKNRKKTLYGWRYIVKANDPLQVVDTWCAAPEQQCKGIVKGKAVYVINGNEVTEK